MASMSWLMVVSALLVFFVVVVHSAPFIKEPHDEPTDIEIEELLKYYHLKNGLDELEELDGIATRDVEGESWNSRWSPAIAKEAVDLGFAETTGLDANSGEGVDSEGGAESRDENAADATSEVKSGGEAASWMPKGEHKKSDAYSKDPASFITDIKSVIVLETDKVQDETPASEQFSKKQLNRDHASFADFRKAQVARDENLQKQAQEAKDGETQDEGVSTPKKTTANEDNLPQELYKLDREEIREWGDPVKELANPKDETDVVSTAQEAERAPLDLQNYSEDQEEEQVLDKVMILEKAQLSKQLKSLASLGDDTNSLEGNEDKKQTDLDISLINVDREKHSLAVEPDPKHALAKQDTSDKDKASHVGIKREGDDIKGTGEVEQEGSPAEKTSESVDKENSQADFPIQDQNVHLDASDKDTNTDTGATPGDEKQVLGEVRTSNNDEGAIPSENLDQKVESSDTERTHDATGEETNAKSPSGEKVAKQSLKLTDQIGEQDDQPDKVRASPMKDTGDSLSSVHHLGADYHEIVSELMQFVKKMNKELEMESADSTSYHLEQIQARARWSKTSEGNTYQKTAVFQDSSDQNDKITGTATGNEGQSQENAANQMVQESDETGDISANTDSLSQEVAQNDNLHQQVRDVDKIAHAGDNSKALDEEVEKKTKVESTGTQDEVKSDTAVLDTSHKTEVTNEKVQKVQDQASSGSAVLNVDDQPDNLELSGDTETKLKQENSHKVSGKTDGLIIIDTANENVKAPERVDVVKTADSKSNVKTPVESVTEIGSNEAGNQQNPSGVLFPEAEPQVEKKDDAKTNIKGQYETLVKKVEASEEDKATKDVLEKSVSSGKENQANYLVPSGGKLTEVQETKEDETEDSNHGDGLMIDSSRVRAVAAKEAQTNAKKQEVGENQGVIQSKKRPTFDGNVKNGVDMNTEMDNAVALSDNNAHEDLESSLDAYEHARCDLQANNIPYAPLAVKNHVIGQIVFKQKKSGGSMEIKSSISGLATDGPAAHVIDVHEYGDLSNGCQATGMKYIGGRESELDRMTPLGESGVLGTVHRDETGNVRLAWTADSAGLVGKHSILGRAVVVHVEGNDQKLACCVVARSSDVTPWI